MILPSLFALLVKKSTYTLNIEHDCIKTNLNILSSWGGFLLIYIWSMIWLDPLKNHVEDDVAQIWNWVSHWKQRAGWDSSITSFLIQLLTNSFTHRWVQTIGNVKIIKNIVYFSFKRNSWTNIAGGKMDPWHRWCAYWTFLYYQIIFTLG